MLFKKTDGGVRWIIAGLGNPEQKYDKTRHNAGFHAIEAIAELNGDDLSREKTKYNALNLLVDIDGQKCVLTRPLTYMNSSGEAIAPLAHFYKIPPERVIVICDDISFAPGYIRIRRSGSAGGHNGLKSVIQMLTSDNFPRIKIGVGSKPPERDLADWVLSSFSSSEQADMQAAYEKCYDIVKLITAGKTDSAMNKFNTK